MKIIGMMGRVKSGKNTAASMLLERHSGGAELAFADKLKDIVGEMFGLSREAMYTDAGKNRPTEYTRTACPMCSSLDIHPSVADNHLRCKKCNTVGEASSFQTLWTPREILQYIGTEGFRTVSPDVWVNFAMRQAHRMIDRCHAFVVFTDCRFRSEAEAIWKEGGEVWKIKRPTTDQEQAGIKGHASETEQDSIKDTEVQAVIVNDGTLDVLRERLEVQFQRFIAAK